MSHLRCGLLGAAVLTLLSRPAWAQSTLGEISNAAKRSTDKSRQALVGIFGNVVNDPLASAASGADTVLASIFQVTNAALLVVAAFLACFMLLRKLSQTAHDGTVFSQQKHVLWGPIRLVWGIATLVPTANGWSLAQLLMLWGASVMGVGVANLGVDASITAFSNGNSMVMQPVTPSTVNLAHSLFETNLCMHAINAGLAQAEAGGALVTADGYIQQAPTDTGFVLKNASFVCGGSDIDTSIEPQAISTNWFSGSISAQELRDAHLGALQTMQGVLNTTAQNFVNAVVQRQSGDAAALPDVEVAIQRAAQQYEKRISAAAATKQGNLADLSAKIGESISESGWWTLGAWYQTYAQANTKLSDAVTAKAAVFGMSAEGDPAMLATYSTAMTAYKAQQGASVYTAPIGTSSVGDYTKGATGADSGKIIGSFFKAPGQRIVNGLLDVNGWSGGQGQLNPLIKMKNLGDYTLGVAETGLSAYTLAKVAIHIKNGWSGIGLAAKIGNAVTSIGDALQGVLDAMSPFVVILIVALFMLGGTLSVYLPMVPFIVWFGAAVNWLIVVGEAVVAAPLWALIHLGGDGDGMGGRASHGYIFLLNVMVRPILMVVGFFLGGACLIAGGTFLNQLFGISVANAQFDSVTGLLSILFFLTVYASMCTNLIHSCFNLVFIVPDQVINWVGGHASSTLGREDNDRMRHSMGAFTHRLEGFMTRFPDRSNKSKGRRPGNGVQL
jgi:conjugal transfer/type IV secretion protein DotA/TraY